MFPPSTLFGFLTASILLALAPGPDNLFVLAQSASKGASAGLMTVLGLCTGLIFHTAAVALGVAAMVAASPVAFTAIKFCGAAYLCFLAWQAFRAAPETLAPGGEAGSPRAFYLRGVAMNISNPKVAIFFLAFLPQFTSAERGSVVSQMIILGLLFLLCALVCFSFIALAAGRLQVWLGRSARGQTILNKVAGVLFLALAARLVTVHL